MDDPTVPLNDGNATTTDEPTKQSPRGVRAKLHDLARWLWANIGLIFLGLGVLVIFVNYSRWAASLRPEFIFSCLLLLTAWVGWLAREERRDLRDIERLQREVARLGRNINPCRSRLNQSPPMLERWVVAKDGRVLRIEPPAAPTCGVDFCRKCGACLVCYGSRPCDMPENVTAYGLWDRREIITLPESEDLRDIAAGAEADVRHSWVHLLDEPARDEFAEGIERRYGERRRKAYPRTRQANGPELWEQIVDGRKRYGG